MAINEFLPFGGATGANVIPQSSYASLGSRSAGFVAGIANPEECNKVWRQASHIAALIGQFIADIGKRNALDDGDFNALLDVFKVAYRSQGTNWLTFGGTANTKTLALNPAPLAQNELIGVPLRGIIGIPNTGPATLNAGFGNVPITRPGGDPLVGDELKGICGFIFDGTHYQIVEGSEASSVTNWFQPPPGFFYAYKNPAISGGNTTLGNSVWTKLVADVEEYDVEGWYNPSTARFQPTQPGFYFISGDCSFDSSAGPSQASHGLRAFINGSASFSTQIGDVPGTHFAGAANGARGVVTGITYLNGSGDFLEPYAFQDFLGGNGTRVASKLRWCGWFVGGPVT
jgi:hypothetical protein